MIKVLHFHNLKDEKAYKKLNSNPDQAIVKKYKL